MDAPIIEGPFRYIMSLPATGPLFPYMPLAERSLSLGLLYYQTGYGELQATETSEIISGSPSEAHTTRYITKTYIGYQGDPASRSLTVQTDRWFWPRYSGANMPGIAPVRVDWALREIRDMTAYSETPLWRYRAPSGGIGLPRVYSPEGMLVTDNVVGFRSGPNSEIEAYLTGGSPPASLDLRTDGISYAKESSWRMEHEYVATGTVLKSVLIDYDSSGRVIGRTVEFDEMASAGNAARARAIELMTSPCQAEVVDGITYGATRFGPVNTTGGSRFLYNPIAQAEIPAAGWYIADIYFESSSNRLALTSLYLVTSPFGQDPQQGLGTISPRLDPVPLRPDSAATSVATSPSYTVETPPRSRFGQVSLAAGVTPFGVRLDIAADGSLVVQLNLKNNGIETGWFPAFTVTVATLLPALSFENPGYPSDGPRLVEYPAVVEAITGEPAYFSSGIRVAVSRSGFIRRSRQ